MIGEPRLGQRLTAGFTRVAWTTLASFMLVMLAIFAILSEVAVRRGAEHSADVIESLLGLYADPAGTPTGVAPGMLADQLVGMGEPFVMTRTTRDDDVGGSDSGGTVYYLSPTMPAQRLGDLSGTWTPEQVRRMMLDALAERARWRYHVLHRHVVNEMRDFDMYVVASRVPHVWGFTGLLGAAVFLLPAAAVAARGGARRTVGDALGPLDRVTRQTRAIHPSDLSQRIDTPTGQQEVTELADGINRMLDRVENAHRALQSFTADASHELRTPFTHIKARVQWCLARDRSEDDIHEAFEAIEKEVERSTKMVDELLLIARGENHQLEVERVPFDLNEVVKEVAEITEAMASGRDLTVETEVNGPMNAVGDFNRTRQILLNLASNAVRYTPSGVITLSTRRRAAQVGALVRDTGIGIAAENRDHIFDRFYRVDPSRARALGGSGLGLTIAKVLAELQGGMIDVASELGNGSTFGVWLPEADLGQKRTNDSR